MKYNIILILVFSFVAASCTHKPEFEMEALSRDVLQNKNHEGIDIKVTPILEEKK